MSEKNLVLEATNCGLMNDIGSVLRRVIDNSKSLLYDVDNNYCEQLSSHINKHIAGKQINFSQRQSYNTCRVKAAVVSFNSGRDFICLIHKKLTNKSPSTRIK